MTWLLIAVVLAMLVAVMIAAKRPSKGVAGQPLPYIKQGCLLTPAERSFLGVLEQAVGGQYRVYAQVRLADLLAVKATSSRSARTTAQNRINGKHADFVLCEKETLEIVCAIELDDASHQKARRKERDNFVEEACRAAGLPLARFVARASYTIQDLRESIQQVAVIKPEPAPKPNVIESLQPAAQLPPVTGSEDKAPACPKCEGPTLLRTVKSGAHAGKRLWGCSSFPTCKGYIPLSK